MIDKVAPGRKRLKLKGLSKKQREYKSTTLLFGTKSKYYNIAYSRGKLTTEDEQKFVELTQELWANLLKLDISLLKRYEWYSHAIQNAIETINENRGL